MKKHLLVASFLLFSSHCIRGQNPLTQYFDGADTIPGQSLFITLDTAATNIWQVGPPQKIIFNSPGTFPNVLVTDTINNYPINNTSSFSYKINSFQWPFGILAIQWFQKLDMDHDHEGGLIEYSNNNGATWFNVFNNPFVYNFYGYDPVNADTLDNGDFAFSGTDSTWKNIWLCFDVSWLSSLDTLTIRHTFVSDSIDTGKEGWMIDNMWVAPTIIHTLGEEPQKEYLRVYPSLTSGIVNIQAKKIDAFHIIELLEVYNASGQLVQKFQNIPTRFFVDLSNHPPGNYFIKIKTNFETGTYPVVLTRNR